MLTHDYVHKLLGLSWIETFGEYLLVNSYGYCDDTLHLSPGQLSNFIQSDYEPKYEPFLQALIKNI